MIGIVFIGDLYVCPYLNMYTEQFLKENEPFEVIFWNRSNEKLNLPSNYIYCDNASKEEQWSVTKAIDFYSYRRWLIKILKTKKYEKLVVLSTLSGMIIADYLRKYKGKYLFDIRDYSYEAIDLFYRIEKRIIENSFATTISSPGFKKFLPSYNYTIAHNIQRSELEKTFKGFRKKTYGEVLNLVWNGTMRYFDHQKGIIKKLANDRRFNIVYHGAGPELEQYIQFCEEIHAQNVMFTGKYNNSDKARLLMEADIINNSYWTEKEQEVRFAISNRFYDGLIYGIPQLVEYGTYKTELCKREAIGIGIPDTDMDNFADILYEWYFSIDVEKFNLSCKKMLSAVRRDDHIYQEMIVRFAKLRFFSSSK